MTKRPPLPKPGDPCQPDPLKAGPRPAHAIVASAQDTDLQAVKTWLLARPIDDLLCTAVDNAVRYVLDGARTFRFDLTSDEVDSDERSSVGTKLQYHVIEQLELRKEPPLDTKIMDIPVEIKGTVGKSWMIPREGQCEITLMLQIDTKQHRFRALLMRAHRAWLTGKKGNQDLKRSPRADAVRQCADEIVPWAALPPEPLRLLTLEQLRVVFGPAGITKRATALFGYLPEVVIPRSSIATVGARRTDPLRRAREAKPHVLKAHDLVILVGTWEKSSPQLASSATTSAATPGSQFHASSSCNMGTRHPTSSVSHFVPGGRPLGVKIGGGCPLTSCLRGRVRPCVSRTLGAGGGPLIVASSTWIRFVDCLGSRGWPSVGC